MILAHREVNESGQVYEQSLISHLYDVGIMAGRLGKEIGLEAIMNLIGYLHDVGKSDRKFQSYIRGEHKKHVNHSSAGGRILDDFISFNTQLNQIKDKKRFRYFQEIISYVIYSHHGLFDVVSYETLESNVNLRFNYDKNEDYHYVEDVIPFAKNLSVYLKKLGSNSIEELIPKAYEEFVMIYKRIVTLSEKNVVKEKQSEEKEYYIACLSRLCLSILKEADIYDSSNTFHSVKQKVWTKEETVEEWQEASEKIEQLYATYTRNSCGSIINKKRTELANEVKHAALLNTDGVYKLELPTGAGKTKAGLRYALTNALQYKRNRIYYITAYLSVLEQNASEIRNIVKNDDIILEHHSNVMKEKHIDIETDEDSYEYKKETYVKESWENLIVLTTMVQFFNTLFKEKASNIRRFCKLINSVIIIDEVQSLPLNVISNFNLMMNFMKEIMHCNIVHCTATQPVLDSAAMDYKLYYGNREGNNPDITNNQMIHLDCFQRVDYYNLTGFDGRKFMTTEEIGNLIHQELEEFKSCLVVLNTKGAVLKLYQYLKDHLRDVEIIYLTTNLCASHRLDIIADIKDQLLQNRRVVNQKKMVCISTRLIEAGVDVDFDVVLRSLAGIDSIVQCAGRCNREGKLRVNDIDIHGKLYMIRYTEENLTQLPEINETVDATEYAIRSLNSVEKEALIHIDIMQRPYYNKYYIENKNKMDYIDKRRRSTMVEQLGVNHPVKDAFYMENVVNIKPTMFQDFKTAAVNFKLIGQDTIGIIVHHKNEELIQELEESIEKDDYVGIKRILQQLQRYTVNVYLTPKLERIIAKFDKIDIYYLQRECYNLDIGVNADYLVDLII